ncbi:MAG: hypothetical protein ABJD11_13595, partial [Gemmatimonadota bacterium]
MVRTPLDVSALFRAGGGRVPIPIDLVRVTLRRADNSIAFDDSIPSSRFTQNGDSLSIPIQVTLRSASEQFTLLATAEGNGVVYYSASGQITASAGQTSATTPLTPTYVGPGAQADSVAFALDTVVQGGDSVLLTATAFQNNAPLTGVPIGFISSDISKLPTPRSVALDQAWAVAPTTLNDSVSISAVTATGLTSTLGTLRFVPRAAALTLVSGDQQSVPAGTSAPLPLVVRAQDASAAPYRGHLGVTFAVTSGPAGTVVTPTSTVTDTGGFAQASVTAGNGAGPIVITATGAGLTSAPVTFTLASTTVVGPAASVAAVTAISQSAPVNTTVSASPSVVVKDANGSPVSGVSVTFAVASGGGSVTAPAQTTNASGIATVGSWKLGTAAGANTLTATVTALAPVTFTGTGTAGLPTTLVKISGDAQSANLNTALPLPLVVEARDAFNNPVPAVSILWVATEGTIPANSQTAANGRAQATWTLGSTQPSPTVNASTLGASPVTFTATTIFPTPTILLAFSGIPGAGVGFPSTIAVTLSSPVASGTLPVALASGNTSIFAISGVDTVYIPQGQSTGTKIITGVAPGTATLTGTAPGYVTGVLSVNVQTRAITLPLTLNVPYGQTASLPVQISSPAPTGGVDIALASSNPSFVTLQAPTVHINAGATTANAVLNGVLPGPSSVTASNPAYTPDTAAVTTAASLNIVQPSASLSASFGTTVTVQFESNNIGIAAPSPGVVVSLVPTDAGCLAVPASLTIPTGLVSVTPNLTYGGSTALPCTTKLKVTAPNIQPDSINVTVNPVPPISFSNTTVGAGLMVNVGASLGASNHGGTTVTLTSLDPTLMLVAPNATTAATTSIGVAIPNGSTFFSVYLHGLNGQTGPARLELKAPGFATDTATITVAQPAADIIFLATTTTSLSPNSFFQIRTGVPNPTHTGMSLEQPVRFGIPGFVATINNSAAAVARLAAQTDTAQSETLTIQPGLARSASTAATGGVEFDPVGPGSTTVTASIPGFVLLPQDTVNVTVTAPIISASPGTVGSGLMTNATGNLGASNHGGVNVTVTSLDPTKLLLAPNPTTVATSAISIPILVNNTFISYYVHGIAGQTGTVQVELAAPGFVTDTVTMTVTQAAADIIFLNSTTTSLSPNTQFQLRTGVPNAQHTAMQIEQQVRFGVPALTATLNATNGAVGQLVTQAGSGTSGSITIAAGQSRSPFGAAAGGIEFDPIGAGVDTVTSTIPGLAALTSDTIAVTVTAPIISASNLTVGGGLMTNQFSFLGATNHGGVNVIITSLNPAVALVAPNATTVATTSVSLPVANNNTAFSYEIHGVDGQVGTALFEIKATGFVTDTITVTVPQPAQDIIFLSTTTTTLAPNLQFEIRVGVPNVNHTAMQIEQVVRFGGSVKTATIASRANGVAQLVDSLGPTQSATVHIVPGQSRSPFTAPVGGVEFDPLGAGTDTVTSSLPGYALLPQDTVRVVVTAPPINLSTIQVGSGLMANLGASLGATNHGGVNVTIKSSDPTVALLAPDATTLGADSIVIFVPNNS